MQRFAGGRVAGRVAGGERHRHHVADGQRHRREIEVEGAVAPPRGGVGFRVRRGRAVPQVRGPVHHRLDRRGRPRLHAHRNRLDAVVVQRLVRDGEDVARPQAQALTRRQQPDQRRAVGQGVDRHAGRAGARLLAGADEVELVPRVLQDRQPALAGVVGAGAGHEDLFARDSQQGRLERLGRLHGDQRLGAGRRFDQAGHVRDGQRRLAGVGGVEVADAELGDGRPAEHADGVAAAGGVAADDVVAEVSLDRRERERVPPVARGGHSPLRPAAAFAVLLTVLLAVAGVAEVEPHGAFAQVFGVDFDLEGGGLLDVLVAGRDVEGRRRHRRDVRQRRDETVPPVAAGSVAARDRAATAARSAAAKPSHGRTAGRSGTSPEASSSAASRSSS